MLIVGFPANVAAHPSDLETLTVDLLLGAKGLEVIDAAVVADTEYEPFPSPEQRRSIADQILAAFGISRDATKVDVAMSERYHEVGFTIHLQRPLSNAKRAALRIDTAPLQRITAGANAKWLKVEVCDRYTRDAVPGAMPSTTSATGESFKLLTDAEQPGRPPSASMQERPGCRVWRLTADEASLTLSARLVASAPAKPGASLFPVTVAAVLVSDWARRMRLDLSSASHSGVVETQNCRSEWSRQSGTMGGSAVESTRSSPEARSRVLNPAFRDTLADPDGNEFCVLSPQ